MLVLFFLCFFIMSIKLIMYMLWVNVSNVWDFFHFSMVLAVLVTVLSVLFFSFKVFFFSDSSYSIQVLVFFIMFLYFEVSIKGRFQFVYSVVKVFFVFSGFCFFTYFFF